jgi:hypothetical protein
VSHDQPIGNRHRRRRRRQNGTTHSNNLATGDYRVLYCENSPHGDLTDTDEAVAEAAAKAMLFGHV